MTHYEKMRENYEDAVFYLLMDQLAGKQEKEYNNSNFAPCFGVKISPKPV